MSPSLRDLVAEYVKSRIQNVKIPRSTSRRFSVKGRISDRLRKGKPKDSFEDASQNEETSLADDRNFCPVEMNSVSQDHNKNDALHPIENSPEELTLVSFLQEHNTESKTLKADAGLTPDGVDASERSLPHDSSFSSVSETTASGSYIPCDALAVPLLSPDDPNLSSGASAPADVEHAPPGLPCTAVDVTATADVATSESSPVPPYRTEFSNSPVGSDILNALDIFDAEGLDLRRFDSDRDLAIPVRSLQTIYEEDPTMLDTRRSLGGPLEAIQETAVSANVTPDPREAREGSEVHSSRPTSFEASLAQPALDFVSPLPWFSPRLFCFASLASQDWLMMVYARSLPPYAPSLAYRPFECYLFIFLDEVADEAVGEVD